MCVPMCVSKGTAVSSPSAIQYILFNFNLLTVCAPVHVFPLCNIFYSHYSLPWVMHRPEKGERGGGECTGAVHILSFLFPFEMRVIEKDSKNRWMGLTHQNRNLSFKQPGERSGFPGKNLSTSQHNIWWMAFIQRDLLSSTVTACVCL